MRGKTTLTARSQEREVLPNELKNWADVSCSITRSGIGGTLRKFASKFEFAGDAYSFLQSLYLEQGADAQCVLSVYLQNDTLELEKAFECPLDFSSIGWDAHVLTISAVDSSLAAIVSASKSTTYELAIGEGLDLRPETQMRFARLPMTETATYSFTQGESDEQTGAIRVDMQQGDLPWLGLIGSETSVGKTVYFKDDQRDDDGGYMVEAVKTISVSFDYSVCSATYGCEGGAAEFYAEVFRGQNVVSRVHLFTLGADRSEFLGNYPDESSLPALSGSQDSGKWATVGEDPCVWFAVYDGHSCYWDYTGKTPYESLRRTDAGKKTLSLSAGDKARVVADINQPYARFIVNSSSLKWSWVAIGEPCEIDCLAPQAVGTALLQRMAGASLNAMVEISGYDQRLANTRLMAAESIRGMGSPMLRSSFAEFCDWMETAFGYSYEIGAEEPSPYGEAIGVGRILYTPQTFITRLYQGDVDTANIDYDRIQGRFLYNASGSYYIAWEGMASVCQSNGQPRTDKVYVFEQGAHTFQQGSPQPIPYEADPSMSDKPFVSVRFMHRAELFSGTEPKAIATAKELSYSVDQASIYSAVTVGYEPQDYDCINGRDEFNFSITYDTGSKVSDKELKLLSKYRADSYGIEFAAQKRGEDTTDTDSDSDVFFVLLDGNVPDHSIEVEGTLSPSVFNAAFSPAECAKANAGYISMQAAGMSLRYASATGNSSVTIGGERLDADIILSGQLLTIGRVEFATDDQEAPDPSGAVSVCSGGMEYVGYVSDVDFKCFRTEPAKYKLLIKSATKI